MQNKDCTLVTAYYSIQSKQPKNTYMDWASNFLKLNANIVLFTSNDMKPVFQRMRGYKPIEIITKPFEELYMWKKYKSEWKKHKTLDHESYHTPELYAIWSSKFVFVDDAIKRNPFHTKYFYWCDIGAFRNDPTIHMVYNFPLPRFPKNKVLLSSVNRLEESDKIRELDDIVGNFQKKDRIVGGLWGGEANACLRLRRAYETMLIRYFENDRFAGKDQSVMLSAYLEDTSLAEIVKPTDTLDEWFFAERLLSDNNVEYRVDSTYS